LECGSGWYTSLAFILSSPFSVLLITRSRRPMGMLVHTPSLRACILAKQLSSFHCLCLPLLSTPPTLPNTRQDHIPQQKGKPPEWTDRDSGQRDRLRSLYSPTRCQPLRSLSRSVHESGFPSSWGVDAFSPSPPPFPTIHLLLIFDHPSSSPLARMTPSTVDNSEHALESACRASDPNEASN
jgi:hypothetical protein